MTRIIEAVLMDVDGVILDSLDGIVDSINRMLQHFGGCAIDRDYFRRYRLDKFHDLVRACGVPDDIEWETICRVYVEISNRPEIYYECGGIRPVLEYIRSRDIPIWLVSAAGDELTHCKIAHHDGLLDYFCGIRGGEDKSVAITSICDQLGLAPGNVLFISDMGRDFKQSRQVGVGHEIGIVSGFSTRDELLEYTPHVADTHHDLLTLVQQALMAVNSGGPP